MDKWVLIYLRTKWISFDLHKTQLSFRHTDIPRFYAIVVLQKKTQRVKLHKSNIIFLKSIIFWDMTPRSPLSCTRCFGGTYHLHLQSRRISSANQRASRWQAECSPVGRPVYIGNRGYNSVPIGSSLDRMKLWTLMDQIMGPIGSDTFLRNVGCNPTDYTASYPRRWYSS
jgi:hypothetical protein